MPPAPKRSRPQFATRSRAMSTSAGSHCRPRPSSSSRQDSVLVQWEAIGALPGHRLDRVGDGDDPGQQRYLVGGEPVGVARPVPALVMVADDRDVPGRAARAARASDHRSPDAACIATRSAAVSEPRLQQDGVRDSDLAHVVEDCTKLERVELRVGEPMAASDLECQGSEAFGVALHTVVANLDRIREHASDGRCEQPLAQLLLC